MLQQSQIRLLKRKEKCNFNSFVTEVLMKELSKLIVKDCYQEKDRKLFEIISESKSNFISETGMLTLKRRGKWVRNKSKSYKNG